MPLEIIELDASTGGQIFRYGIGLSALLGRPVRVKNIRKQASNPGLQMQHLTSLSTLSEICSAETKGMRLHSMEIEFSPKQVKEKSVTVNIGTAGSVTLLLQSLLLPSMLKKITLSIIGGTDVPSAPSYYYFKEVLFPLLKRTSARFEIELTQHGFFPKGRGKVFFSSKPARFALKPVFFTERGELQHIKIFSQCSDLPKEVALNQASAAKRELEKLGVDVIEKIFHKQPSETIGSSIDLIAFFSSGAIIGANALGAKGKPAIEVGKEAAKKLFQEIETGKAIDQHLADQLIPFMALADGYSTIHTTKLTEHCISSIRVTESLLPVKFEVKGILNTPAEIFVEGIAWKP